VEIPRERFDDAPQRATLDPGLKAAMTRLVRRIARREVLPRSARPEDPQDAIEYIPRIAPWPAAPIAAKSRLR